MGLIFPASVPFLKDKGAIMVLIVSSWYSGVVKILEEKVKPVLPRSLPHRVQGNRCD